MRSLPLALAMLLALTPLSAAAHSDGILVRSDTLGGGTLIVGGVEDESILALLVFCSNGECLWASAEGSIATPDEVEPGEDGYPLTAGTAVSVEIVAIDVGASVKVGSTKLDDVGESVALGSAPDAHAHVLWQIEAADDDLGERVISLRFRAEGGDYAPSETIDVRVTNAGDDTTTTTFETSTTSTSLTTLAGATCGNGVIEPAEICDAGPEPWSAGRACDEECTWLTCGDPDADGGVHATDALFVLATAVGLESCDPCVCDVDEDSGVSGSDALRALRVAVGLGAAKLTCPACLD